MTDFIARFSDTRDSIVNPDLINIRRRQNENIVDYIDDLCKEIVKMINGSSTEESVTYTGYVENDKNSIIREVNRSKSKAKKQFSGIVLSTEETYARTYNFNFVLRYDGEIRKQAMTIYVPMICDDSCNYIIKGNKYCIPFQMVDAVTYNRVDVKNKYDEVCLKTSLQDIKMQRFVTVIKDVYGVSYTTHKFNIKLNAKVNKVPFLLFYFARFGFYKTLEYFNLSNPVVGVRIYAELPPDDDDIHKDYSFFKFGGVFLSVRTIVLKNYPVIRELIGTILSTKKKSILPDTINQTTFWLMTLGVVISPNNTLSKGISLSTTFDISLDPNTSENIKQFIGKEFKTIYAAVRWMFLDYAINVSKDMSMSNKRLRLSEYVVDPLKQVFKKKAYDYSKQRGGFRDIKRLETVFKIQPSIILDAINGKTQNFNTGKYSNAVNDLALLHSLTKATQTGPGAAGGGKTSYVPKEFKRLHPSMIGRSDLISTSVNNPGCSFNILPNCDIDPISLGFKSLNSKLSST